MKTLFSIILVVAICGCATLKNKVSDQHKACAAVCGALDAARCWDEPNFYEFVQAGADLGACFEGCMLDNDLTLRIDTQCLFNAKKCDLAQCVEVSK